MMKSMKCAVVNLLVLGIVAAQGKDADVAERIAAAKFSPCTGNEHACAKPSMKYERVVSSQPGFQWIDNGGYCGSWAIQRAAVAAPLLFLPLKGWGFHTIARINLQEVCAFRMG